MSSRAILLFSSAVLAACGSRDPGPVPVLSIAQGQYTSTIATACVGLAFGRRDRQTFTLDADCDGQAELQSDFAVDEDVILTDAGSLRVTAVGTSSFSGLWSDGESTTPVRFERIAGR